MRSKLQRDLIAFALALPDAEPAHPWGEIVAKVNKRVFVFFGTEASQANRFGCCVKLTASNALAMALPFVEPAGYGLGKSGWVYVKLPAKGGPPLGLLKDWVTESYRAIAPKRCVRELDDHASSSSAATKVRTSAKAGVKKRAVAAKPAALVKPAKRSSAKAVATKPAKRATTPKKA